MQKVIDTYYLVKIGKGWLTRVRAVISVEPAEITVTNLYSHAMRLSEKSARALANEWGGEVFAMQVAEEAQ